MTITFTATPDVDNARITVNAAGGVAGERFYMIRRDDNGSNLIRETSEIGALWLKDVAQVRNQLAKNPSFESVSATPVTTRTNLASNPSFQLDNTGVTGNYGTTGAGAISRPTTGGVDGLAHTRMQWTTASTAVGAYMDLASTGALAVGPAAFSVYVRNNRLTQTFQLSLQGAAAAGATGIVNAAVATVVGAWTRITWTGTIATAGTFTLRVTATGRVFAIGDQFDADHVLAEQRILVDAFFDGSTAAAGDFTYTWSGTANASTSNQRGLAPSLAVGAGAISSTVWFDKGTKSAQIIPQNTSTDTYISPEGDIGAVRYGFVAGKTYNISAAIRLTAPQTGSLLGYARSIVAYTKVGAAAYVEKASIQAANVAGVTRLSIALTIPAGATEAFIRLYNGASRDNGDVWWDSLLVEEAAVLRTNLATNPSFEAASGTVNVRTNLCTNPSLETDAAGWSHWQGMSGSAVGTRETTGGASGAAFFRVKWTVAQGAGGGNRGGVYATFPAVAGKTYSASMPVRPSKSQPMGLNFEWLDGAGGQIGAEVPGPTTTSPANVWTTIKNENKVAPAGTASIRITAYAATGSAPWAVDDTLDGDGLILEEGATIGTYFDGSTAAAGDFTYTWSGTANASTSNQQAPAVVGVTSANQASAYRTGSSGAYEAKILFNGSTIVDSGLSFQSILAVAASKTYTVSVDLTSDVARVVKFSAQGSGVVNQNSANISLDAGVKSRQSWSFTTTATAPAGVSLYILRGDLVMGSINVNNMLIEESLAVGVYFDGSTTPTAGNANSWAGAPNAAISHESVGAKSYFDGSTGPNHSWLGTANNSNSKNEDGSFPIVLSDYEARQGMATDYILTNEDGLTSASLRLTIPRWGTWIKDPFRPFMNTKVLWNSDSSYTRQVDRAILKARGAKFPAVQHDRRMAPSGTVRIATEDNATAKKLTSLLEVTNVIMIDVDEKFGVPVRYVSVGDLTGSRVGKEDTDLGWEARYWELPIQEVAVPQGAPIAQSLTYDSLAAAFGSYVAIPASVLTYNDLASGNWSQ